MMRPPWGNSSSSPCRGCEARTPACQDRCEARDKWLEGRRKAAENERRYKAGYAAEVESVLRHGAKKREV